MRENFDIAFSLTVGLEGVISCDPNDPGGFTIYGLAKRYHPWVTRQTTIEQVKPVYLSDYWIPQGCDEAPFPWDLVLFDSAVNPQNDPKLPYAGNRELMELGPECWQEYQLLRMARYMRRSNSLYVKGHIFRVLKLSEKIRELVRERKLVEANGK